MKEEVEKAAKEFDSALSESVNVKEIIYIMAFQEKDSEEDSAVKLVVGSTRAVPNGVRGIMVDEAKKRYEASL
jgi:KaiC/GvpD/RAD55 family RecA-like ATPase